MNNTINIPVLSIAYLPPVQYFCIMATADVVFIESCEYFIKQTYRSRCHILGTNGVQILSVPVVKNHSAKTLIRDVRIDYAMRWQQQHWRAMTAAYNNSPFFAYYADELHPFYEKRMQFLFDFNYELLQKIVKWLGLSVQIFFTDTYNKFVDADFRNTITTKAMDKEQIFTPQAYYQRFAERFGFVPNLSIADLLFNEGNNANAYLSSERSHFYIGYGCR
jgi:hypothetical protein